MKEKILKIMISTALVIPADGTSVLAHSDEVPAASSTLAEMTVNADDLKKKEQDADLNAGSENDEVSPAVHEEPESGGNEEPYGLPDHIAFEGTDGIHWYIDENNVMYMEAGELTGNNHWRNYNAQIREIRVVPNDNGGKLILPKNSDYLFSDCRCLTNIEASSFDTSKVENMDAMFCSCTSLTNLDLSSFDTSKVENMDMMFCGCISLTNLDLSSFDTSHVTGMMGMFTNCRSLESIDLSSFDTGNVKNMLGMFFNCRSLKRLNLSSFEATNLRNMQSMFEKCHSLERLDLSNFDTSGAGICYNGDMFNECNSLRDIKLSKDFFNGNMVYDHPYDKQTKWVQAANPDHVKSWEEMTETWNESDAGWWSLYLPHLRFDTFKGTKIEPLSEMPGSCIDLSKYVPSREGYSFTGWYLDEDWTKKAGDQYILNDDATVYAGWKINKFGMYFDTNGGNQILPSVVEYDDWVSLNYGAPYKDGYIFTGWYLDPECTVKAPNLLIIKSDITVYAGWEQT